MNTNVAGYRMDELGRALDALQRGEIVGIPTDTVYGIGADPWNEAALQRLFDVKGRSAGMPIPLLAADVEDVARLAVLPEIARDAATRWWPGPLTMVLRRAEGLPPWMGDAERNTIGVRVPDHSTALALLRRSGPLAVTSANRSGELPALDDRQAADVLGGAVAVYLLGDAAGDEASTVVDLSTPTPAVLRRGPIRWEQM